MRARTPRPDDPRGPLSALAGAGAVALPSLSRAQLVALGGLARSPLVDAAERAWEDSLEQAEREGVAGEGFAQLVEAGLLRAGKDELEAAPPLAAVVAARADPSVLVLLGQPGREQREAPRAYGRQDDDGALSWLLVERPVTTAAGGAHFAAVGPDVAAAQIADWLTGAGSRIVAGLAPPTLRTVEVLHPGSPTDGPRRARLAVVAGSGRLARCEVAEDGTLGEPQACELQDVRAAVRAALHGEPEAEQLPAPGGRPG